MRMMRIIRGSILPLDALEAWKSRSNFIQVQLACQGEMDGYFDCLLCVSSGPKMHHLTILLFHLQIEILDSSTFNFRV
jgi:hypothetical protein